jgi:hypothetical protein
MTSDAGQHPILWCSGGLRDRGASRYQRRMPRTWRPMQCRAGASAVYTHGQTRARSAVDQRRRDIRPAAPAACLFAGRDRHDPPAAVPLIHSGPRGRSRCAPTADIVDRIIPRGALGDQVGSTTEEFGETDKAGAAGFRAIGRQRQPIAPVRSPAEPREVCQG